jgi:hypothetical protein
LFLLGSVLDSLIRIDNYLAQPYLDLDRLSLDEAGEADRVMVWIRGHAIYYGGFGQNEGA